MAGATMSSRGVALETSLAAPGAQNPQQLKPWEASAAVARHPESRVLGRRRGAPARPSFRGLVHGRAPIPGVKRQRRVLGAGIMVAQIALEGDGPGARADRANHAARRLVQPQGKPVAAELADQL